MKKIPIFNKSDIERWNWNKLFFFLKKKKNQYLKSMTLIMSPKLILWKKNHKKNKKEKLYKKRIKKGKNTKQAILLNMV